MKKNIRRLTTYPEYKNCIKVQMGKKVRYQILRGSLLQPILRYTLKLSVAINPVSDPRGSNMAKYWHQIAGKSNPQFKQPSKTNETYLDFETDLKHDYKSVSAYMVVDFINGWKHGFFFRNSTEQEISTIYE